MRPGAPPHKGRCRSTPLKRLFLAAAIFGYALLCTTGVAQAHALLLRSVPLQDAVLAHEPAVIHLWFSEDLNASLSKAVVWNVHRSQVDRGDDRITNNRELTVSLKPHLPDGTYLVLWTSVSSQDGHVLKGAYLFSIGHRGPAPASPNLSGGANGQAFPPDLLQFVGLLSRTLELASSALWLGLSLFLVAVFPATDGSGAAKALERGASLIAGRLMPVALVALLLSRLATLVLQANTLASGDWSATFSATAIRGLLLETEYGHLWIAMQSIVLVALAVSLIVMATHPADQTDIGAPAARPANRHWALLRLGELFPRLSVRPFSFSGLQLLLAIVASYLLAASGHAATVNLAGTGAGILTAPVLFDWLHIIATGLWVGGIFAVSGVLVPAFIRLKPASSIPLLDTLDRFSPFAYGSVGVLAATGGFNAKVHVPSWAAFFDSVYGRALIVKSVLVLTMIAISAFTVFVVRPRLRRRPGSGPAGGDVGAGFLQAVLVRWLRIEALLGIGVFAATAMLNAYPVPVTFGASSGPIAITHHTNQGLAVTLKLTPGKAGLNTFTVLLRQAKKPVPLADVRILETMLDMSMGTQFILLNQKGPGTFKGPGDVGMGGHWDYLVQIRLPNRLKLIYQDFRVLVGP